MIDRLKDVLFAVAIFILGFAVWKLAGIVRDPIGALDDLAGELIPEPTENEVAARIELVQKNTGIGWMTEKKKRFSDPGFGSIINPYGVK